MSFEDFAFLLSADEPDRAAPNASEFRDASDFVLQNWWVLPVIGPRLLKWAGKSYEDSPAARRVRDKVTSVRALARIQSILCRRLTQRLEQEGIPYSLLKGTATRWLAYPEPELRSGCDLDVAVSKPYLNAAEDLAQQLGFLRAQWDPVAKFFIPADLAFRSLVESQHYELGFLVRRQVIHNLPDEIHRAIVASLPMVGIWELSPEGELICYVSVDIHHGLTHRISVDPLIELAVARRFDDVTMRFPRLDWAVFHLVIKIYSEGTPFYNKSAYEYADLTRLIRLFGEGDAANLLQLLETYKLERAGYFVLRRLVSTFGMTLEPTLNDFIATQEQRVAVEDASVADGAGDMWPNLWHHS